MLVPNKAYVRYDGTDYEVDPTTFSFIESAVEQAQREGGAQGGIRGRDRLPGSRGGLDQRRRLRREPSNDGAADVDGTETTKVSGDLDVTGALEAVIEADRNPSLQRAARSRRSAAARTNSKRPRGEIEDALKSASAEVYVGEDGIVRRVAAQLTIEPKGSDESVEIDFDLSSTASTRSRRSRPRGRQAAQRPLPEARRQPDRAAPGRPGRRRPRRSARTAGRLDRNRTARDRRRWRRRKPERIPRVHPGCADSGGSAELHQEAPVTRHGGRRNATAERRLPAYARTAGPTCWCR